MNIVNVENIIVCRGFAMKKHTSVTVSIIDPNKEPDAVLQLLREVISDAVKLNMQKITPCE